MTSLFRLMIQMSITASYVIAVVLVLRILMRRYPKKYSYYLWTAVLFRLCCPFSFRSALSIFNFSAKRGEEVIIDLTGVPVSPSLTEEGISGQFDLGSPMITEIVKEAVQETLIPQEPVGPELIVQQQPVIVPAAEQVNKISASEIAAVIWIIGIAALIMYAMISYLRLRKKLRFSVPLYGNIRQAEVESPFLMGLFKPIIYVPFEIDESALEMSIAHETYHLKRKDHWVRALSYCLLSIYWMNPLCWIAYFLMIKDMELSCDEHVLSGGKDLRAEYSNALLRLSTKRRSTIAAPVTFGGANVKERIKNAMRYKRAGKLASVIAALLCMLALVSCAFNGVVGKEQRQSDSSHILPTGMKSGGPVVPGEGNMERASEGASPQRVTTPQGIYFLKSRQPEGKGFNIVFVDYQTDQKQYLCNTPGCRHDDEKCNSYIENDCLLLTDTNKDCLILLDPVSGAVWKVSLDGKLKEKRFNIGASCSSPFFDRDTFQTSGSKLYITMKDTSSKEKKLFEIDVDSETSKVLYTFESQSVCGGFGDYLILRTDLGSLDTESDSVHFSPSIRCRFELLNVRSGEIKTVLEVDLPLVNLVSGHNIMWMTWNTDHYTTHLYDICSGKETASELDVFPEYLMDEPNLNEKYARRGYALDDTHFTLSYGEYQRETDENGKEILVTGSTGRKIYLRSHYCIIDAENGTAYEINPCIGDVTLDCVIFGENEKTFYMTTSFDSDPVLIAVIKEELFKGNISGSEVVELPQQTETAFQSMIVPLREWLFISRGYDPDKYQMIDFYAKKGTEVFAAFGGYVGEVSFNSTAGNYITVWNGDTWAMYSHLDSFTVKEGDTVKQGDVLGYVGETGDATGPILTFLLVINGIQVDPSLYLAGLCQ